MSTVVSLEHGEHQAVQALLPWYVRGRLGGAELEQVESHLLSCAECRRELEAEQPLQQWLGVAGAPAPAGGSDVETGLARLRGRLDPPRPATRPSPRWMPWALGLQGAAICVLATVLLLPAGEAPRYQGLSSGAAAPNADVILMFKPGVSEQALRELLLAQGARIVAGPTETGAYLLRVEARGLEGLRASPQVALAERLQPGAGR
jgi:hypothetical protein